MIQLGSVPYTLSEVVQMIKNNPDTPWHAGYDNYLIKIERSGSSTFTNYGDLIMKLANYVMGENGKTGRDLDRYRGDGPTANSAMKLAPLDSNRMDSRDRTAIQSLMNSGGVGSGITNKSTHNSDPETGLPKGRNVTVSEFYVNGADGRRATKRIEGNKTTYYYSDNHVANTYKYQRLT